MVLIMPITFAKRLHILVLCCHQYDACSRYFSRSVG